MIFIRSTITYSLILSCLLLASCSESTSKVDTKRAEKEKATEIAKSSVSVKQEVKAKTVSLEESVEMETKLKEKPVKAEKNETIVPVKSVEKIRSVPSEISKDIKSNEQKEEIKSTAEIKEVVTAVQEVPEEIKQKVEETVGINEPKPTAIVAAKPNHSRWNNLLQKHVSSSGSVNYKGIVADRSDLESYCEDLASNPISPDWSRGEKMAYWINAYNAFTVKLIIDNYPVAKITDLENGKPWDKKWIKLGSKTYSLNQIENDILRPEYKEARIHFAVNCAAKSCPPLLNKAWTAQNLEQNFEIQTRAFINNAKYNQVSGENAKLSKIFDWYGEDFGDLKAFINKYSKTKIGSEAEIGFMKYNWNLNS